MAVKIEDRPLEQVREEVIDQLVMNYSHGHLSFEAFERRLDQAMASNSNVEISELAADLELEVDKEYVEQKKQDFSVNYQEGESEDVEHLISIFGGSNRTGAWQVPKEIRTVSVFGGSDIDFTDAVFVSREVKIKSFCMFGGVDINVPENVNVISKTFCIFGGVDNSVPSLVNANTPTIIIEGLVIFGGMDISVKRTLKERFVAFADELKNMFS